MRAEDFIAKYRLGPDWIDMDHLSEKMLQQCTTGLNEKQGILPMIPTYLKISGNVPFNEPVIVIDAGGTNFRSAVVVFNEGGAEITNLRVKKMPGIKESVSWDSFISFTADEIEPLLAYSSVIGFCFSYNAVVTPSVDAVVVEIDKEVKIHESEGRLVGASLTAELAERGFRGVRCFILNDTAAVLLGGYSGIHSDEYGNYIGQVSGTGTNTCCILPSCRICKLQSSDSDAMIVNMESGSYDCMERSELDDMLDALTDSRGEKRFEKMTAGVYLGPLSRLAFQRAFQEGFLKDFEFSRISGLGEYDTSTVDAWASGNKLDDISDDPDTRLFIQNLSRSIIQRSAKLMASNILAILKLTESGLDPDKPACVFAEGSLVQKSRTYQEYYSGLLSDYFKDSLGRYVSLVISNESTLPGSAAAALLNC